MAAWERAPRCSLARRRRAVGIDREREQQRTVAWPRPQRHVDRDIDRGAKAARRRRLPLRRDSRRRRERYDGLRIARDRRGSRAHNAIVVVVAHALARRGREERAPDPQRERARDLAAARFDAQREPERERQRSSGVRLAAAAVVAAAAVIATAAAVDAAAVVAGPADEGRPHNRKQGCARREAEGGGGG